MFIGKIFLFCISFKKDQFSTTSFERCHILNKYFSISEEVNLIHEYLSPIICKNFSGLSFISQNIMFLRQLYEIRTFLNHHHFHKIYFINQPPPI